MGRGRLAPSSSRAAAGLGLVRDLWRGAELRGGWRLLVVGLRWRGRVRTADFEQLFLAAFVARQGRDHRVELRSGALQIARLEPGGHLRALFAQTPMILRQLRERGLELRVQAVERRKEETVLQREVRLQGVGEALKGQACGFGVALAQSIGHQSVELVELPVLARDAACRPTRAPLEPRLARSAALCPLAIGSIRGHSLPAWPRTGNSSGVALDVRNAGDGAPAPRPRFPPLARLPGQAASWSLAAGPRSGSRPDRLPVRRSVLHMPLEAAIDADHPQPGHAGHAVEPVALAQLAGRADHHLAHRA